MSVVKKILLVLAVIVAVFCAMGAFFLFTTTGFQSLVKIAQLSFPDFAVVESNGRFFNATLKGVKFKANGVAFVGNLSWQIDPSSLFSGLVLFENIAISDSSLSIDEAQSSSEATPAKSSGFTLPSLPMNVDIRSFLVQQMQLQYNGVDAQLTTLQSALLWNENGIDLSQFLVKGSWNHYTLDLNAAIQCFVDGTLSIRKTQLVLGDNQIDLNGWMRLGLSDPTFDLTVQARAFDFERFLPAMQGHLKGRAHLAGSLFAPRLAGELDLDRFSFKGNSIESARWRAYATTEGLTTFEANTRLTMHKANFAGMAIDEVVFQAEGSAPKHKARLLVTSPQGSLTVGLDAGLDAKQLSWKGQLNEMKFENPLGPLTMTKPLQITYEHPDRTLTIKGGEWTHEIGRLSLSSPVIANIQNHSPFDVNVVLKDINSSYLDRFIGESIRLKGFASATLNAQIPHGWTNLPTVRFELNSRDLQARYRSVNEDFVLQLDELGVEVNHKEGQLTTDTLLKIAKNGQLHARISVDDILKERRLSGQFDIDDLTMSLFNAFLDEGEQAQGSLKGHLAFAGDLKKPKLNGELQLEGLEVNSTRLPFEMQKSEMSLKFSDTQGTLRAVLNTPQGHLTLDGAVDWENTQSVSAWVSAKTSGIRVSVPPLLQVDVNSDVLCRLNDGKMHLNGEIGIPWARVAVRDLPPSAVDVSDDVVRLDRPRKRKTQIRSTLPLESDLYVNVGNDVQVQAFGLNAQLQGRLHVIQFDNQLGLNGQMTVPEGQFKAYGQDLIVTKGEFIFAGSASNPLLNLEAIRNPDSTADGVTAGVRVTGNVNRPQVDIFSDPSMSQTEALSYLMRGEGLNPEGDSDNTMLTSALINLGLTQGNRVIGAIGESIGITGLGVETEGVGENSSVAVSGYILPGLKVKYGVGLFDSLATITLRYQILPRLYIEAASGVDQALDVLYTFEFN